MWETRKMKAESAVDTYWSEHMSLYRSEIPEKFKNDWVSDLLETSDVEFNDDDIHMSFQRMVMSAIEDLPFS